MVTTFDIIIVNNPGQYVTVPYKDTQPIFFVLESIRSQLGIKEEDIGRQDLYINGRHLEAQQHTTAHYRAFGRTLTYRNHSKSNMRITIKKLSGISVPLKVHSSMRISELKEMFHCKEGIPSDQPNDQYSLMDYNIQKECVVYLILRLHDGGTMLGMVFADEFVTSNVRKVDFLATAPPGRVASPATNVECKCAKKFGTLELLEESFICPNCDKSDKIVPVTVGFMSCRYHFHGIEAAGEQYTSDWKDATDEDCYQLFNSDKSTTWRRLVIEFTNASDCDECSICLECLRTSVTLGCGHMFHANCTSTRSGSCPNCRFNQDLTTGRTAWLI
ncbi:hypothetical protein BG015_000876 [Linnemannia schmuckeri]|uniref:Uncharacterized protein n=1 Tax=Linnemannia schmuckeri TaxID=64567 RepID=A0A9P5VE51_9FUNG|nr:hypothetical protein BG015_000876 [Linnemannia schmuckeri]